MQNLEIFPEVKRKDIVKFHTLSEAYDALNRFTSQRFVFLGDHDDPSPYWVVDARTATKLEKIGYERA